MATGLKHGHHIKVSSLILSCKSTGTTKRCLLNQLPHQGIMAVEEMVVVVEMTDVEIKIMTKMPTITERT